MPNNVGSGSQRAGGSGSGIEPDEGKAYYTVCWGRTQLRSCMTYTIYI